jgi:PAS domain S-box-containing protein
MTISRIFEEWCVIARRPLSSLRVRLIALVLAALLLSALVVTFTAADYQSLVRALILLGLVGVFSLALAWWGAGVLILRPANRLMSAIERLSRGELSARTGLAERNGEIARLGQAFDAMAAALERQEAGRREAEAQLQESERRYRRLVELSPEAILVRIGDEIAFVNPAAARLLGATDPAQLIGQRFWDFIHPEAWDLAREHIQPSDASQSASHTELRFQRRDATAFEAEVSISSLVYRGQPATQIILRDITERKQVEAALRESEERFRTMADDAPVLIWMAGPDALRTFFNEPWLDFTGRALAQEEGTGWTDGVHPDDYQRYLDAYVSAFKARQSFELEYRLRRADGVYRWLVDIGVPRFTPDNQLAGYIGTCLDITERHEAEEALRLSRDQFAIILQGADDGITAQDPTGRLRYANDAAARMFGYASAEALLAAPWQEVLRKFEIFDEADQPFPADRLPGQLALQGVFKTTTTVRLRPVAAGDERWLTIKATPVFNEREQVELAVNIFQDITELKHAGVSQRLLAEAGRLLTTPVDDAARLADVAHLAVPSLADWCAMDVVGENNALQRAAVAGTDSARAAMAKGHPFELDAPHGAPRVVRTGEPELYPFVPDSLLEAVARDKAHVRALRILDLKSAMVTPLMARGRPIGALTFVCVDSRRRYGRADLALAEELARRVALALDNVRLYYEAQKLNATLEQRVSTRTAQLLAINTRLESEVAEREEAQRRLEESQAQLRRLSAHLQAAREEERIRIAREIHDELGQALAGLKMDVAWLQRSLNRQAPPIASKLEDMSVLIDSTVQAVRRISAELRPSLLDDLGLAAAIEWQLDEFRERTGLECVFVSNLKNTALDTNRATALFRIFQEALTNVARHANASQVTVHLDEAPDSLSLSIQDNGRGISEEEMRQAKSFGLLGMRERVHLLEGEIDIHGAPGQGTTVTVRIPLRKEMKS